MTESYDLVVVGGGIHGAGVAQAASAKGFSVLVLEQTGIASGTSSRSSKLIHGGLRYLESGEFSLVRECLQERALLLKLAPHLVKLKNFYIPVYKGTTRRPWLLNIGLSLYSLQGGFHSSARFSRVKKKYWNRLDGIETAQLEAVFQYYDAQTNDAALTNAVMQSAQQMGAQVKVPALFTGATLGQSDKHTNIIEYFHNGKNKICTAKVIVNAAGPWAHQVLGRISPNPLRLQIDLVQGTHIVVPGTLTKGIYYVEADDKRVVFIMPWYDNIMIGTTETPYLGEPADVKPLPHEEAYLMKTLLRYFPKFKLDQNILSSTAGLRVLPLGRKLKTNRTESVNSRSRETILHFGQQERLSLLTIYGGKLTTYRLTAERVMKRISNILPVRKVIADTRNLKL